jgi:hypothetical protein
MLRSPPATASSQQNARAAQIEELRRRDLLQVEHAAAADRDVLRGEQRERVETDGARRPADGDGEVPEHIDSSGQQQVAAACDRSATARAAEELSERRVSGGGEALQTRSAFEQDLTDSLLERDRSVRRHQVRAVGEADRPRARGAANRDLLRSQIAVDAALKPAVEHVEVDAEPASRRRVRILAVFGPEIDAGQVHHAAGRDRDVMRNRHQQRAASDGRPRCQAQRRERDVSGGLEAAQEARSQELGREARQRDPPDAVRDAQISADRLQVEPSIQRHLGAVLNRERSRRAHETGQRDRVEVGDQDVAGASAQG